jgi:hypothetical protein
MSTALSGRAVVLIGGSCGIAALTGATYDIDGGEQFTSA